jgi:hypothetical protein
MSLPFYKRWCGCAWSVHVLRVKIQNLWIAVAILGRDIYKDAALEFTECGSSMVVWRRYILMLLVGLWAALIGSWWWSASGGVACDCRISVNNVRVRWFALWVSSGPILLLSISTPVLRSRGNLRNFSYEFIQMKKNLVGKEYPKFSYRGYFQIVLFFSSFPTVAVAAIVILVVAVTATI